MFIIARLVIFAAAGVLATSPTEPLSPETSAASAVIPGVIPDPSSSPDLAKLFGLNNTPTVDHVAGSGEVARDSQEGYPIYRAAVTVILALTKCSPGGLWIKSMFNPTNSNHFIDQGGNYTRVMLFSQSNGTEWGDWTRELDRNNLERVEGLEFDRDPDGTEYDNPWWPWALIEGALEAGWSPNTSDTLDYHWDELMHILTGEEVVLTNTTEMSSDDLWDEYLTKADVTPILIEWNTTWSVVMSPSVREGVKWLGWADPYAAHAFKDDENNEKDGRLTRFTKYSTFPNVTQMMHLKGLVSFNSRPTLQGGS